MLKELIMMEYIFFKLDMAYIFFSACDGGMHGEKCSIPCGNCLASEQCHHINGTCINGCVSGYKVLTASTVIDCLKITV